MPLDFSLDFPLDFALDGCDFGVISQIKALNPLVVTDSALLNPANVGRPIPQRTVRSFDGVTQYVSFESNTPEGFLDSLVTIEVKFKSLVGSQALWAVGGGGSRCYLSGATIHLNSSTNTGVSVTQDVWVKISVYYDNVGNATELYIDGGLAWTGLAPSTVPLGSILSVCSRVSGSSAGLFSDANVAEFNSVGNISTHYDFAENGGTTALDSSGNGNHGTCINNPVVVVDNSVGSDPLNERGFSLAYDAGVNDSYDLGQHTIGSNETWKAEVIVKVDALVNYALPIGIPFLAKDMFLLIFGSGSARVYSKGENENSAISIVAGHVHNIEYGYDGVDVYGIIDGVKFSTTALDQSESVSGELKLHTDSATGDAPITIYSAKFTIGGVKVYDSQDDGEFSMKNIGTDSYVPATTANPAIDALGNATQWQGSTYPVLPNITGTSGAFTALNTNVADDGDQTPAIRLAGLPVTWTQGDANTPRFQAKDNGDSTSSLALGLPSDPTPTEQISIDKYHE